jgi:hypothetical protein
MSGGGGLEETNGWGPSFLLIVLRGLVCVIYSHRIFASTKYLWRFLLRSSFL